MPSHSRFSFIARKAALLAGASAAALAVASAPVMGAQLGGNNATYQPSPAAIAAAQSGAEQAARLAAQARSSLLRATQAVQAVQAAQSAARAAAQTTGAAVPNGLRPGGLEAAPGAVPGSELWQGARLPTEAAAGGRTRVEIEQIQQKAILTWRTFNVGRETDLVFNQKAGGADANQWIALNRVLDPSASPSRILGSIKADGQVYVINQNGIVFGGASQINVHTLVASSLDFVGKTLTERNDKFKRGLLFNPPPAGSSFTEPRVVLGTIYSETNQSRPGEVFAPGDGVTVEAGARIATQARGAAMLFGHNVVNQGSIASPDGQVVLAAGDSIYLAPNFVKSGAKDLDLRGVQVGVDHGGLALNAGLIDTPRGNITMTGKSVVQTGALTASTAARANGSITLVAGDAINRTDRVGYLGQDNSYDVTLAPGSVIAIGPDAGSETAIGFEQYRSSKIDVRGRFVAMGQGATIYAPGGRVALLAGKGQSQEGGDNSRLYIDRGALIDVAGLTDVTLPMERNTLTVDLRLSELRDFPALRASFLRGKKISLDIRQGTKIADLSGYYALIERGVTELMAAGGSVQLGGGAVITRQGSVIDLSGGYLRYLDGMVRSTTLIGADGRLYDISSADPARAYVGIFDGFTMDHRRWGVKEVYASPLLNGERFEQGYVEGRNAGALKLGPMAFGEFPRGIGGEDARVRYLALDGDIRSEVVAGARQTSATVAVQGSTTYVQDVSKQVPTLASFTAGYLTEPKGGQPSLAKGSSIIIGVGAPLPAEFTATSKVDPEQSGKLIVPSRYFDGRTFGKLALYSGDGGAGDLAIPAGVTVDLGPGGALIFRGSHARVDGAIVAPGGSVTMGTIEPMAGRRNGADLTWDQLTRAQKPWIRLGRGAVIDVGGLWQNLVLDGAAKLTPFVNGGTVNLVSADDLILAQGSIIDVSGGGRLAQPGALTVGDGGNIVLQNDVRPNIVLAPATPGGVFVMKGELRGQALGKGGSLTIGTAQAITIATGGAVKADLAGSGAARTERSIVLRPEFFQHGGFSTFSLSSARDLVLEAGVTIVPSTESYLWDQAVAPESGVKLSTALKAAVRAEDVRAPMRLVLGNGTRSASGDLLSGGYDVVGEGSNFGWMSTFYGGAIRIGDGSRILMDPGSSVLLRSLHDIYIDGTIVAAGGAIDVAIRNDVLEPSMPYTLRLGPHARLLAPGYQKTVNSGLRAIHSVEAGGTVSLAVRKDGVRLQSIGLNGFIDTDRRSVIDVSGIVGVGDLARGPVDSLLNRQVGPTVARTVSSDAGSVLLFGASGILAGAIKAAPGSSEGRGGTVTISTFQPQDPAYWAGLSQPPDILVVKPTGAEATETVLPVSAQPADSTGVGRLVVFADRLAKSGADKLSLAGLSAIAFDGDVSLGVRRELDLITPVLGLAPTAPATARVALIAPYVRFAYAPTNEVFLEPDVPAAPPTVAGSLVVAAGLIDFDSWLDLGGILAPDNVALGGFAKARFSSSGDIRLSSHQGGPVSKTGRIQSAGALVFESAQTYITTPFVDGPVDFSIQSGRSVTFRSNGGSAPMPFAAGGALLVAAPDIVQAGVLRAPQGRIELRASHSLLLAPGSLTSTSLEGRIVPIGRMVNGQFPNYPTGDGPQKVVKLAGQDVAVAAGAVIDVSGGGDLSAYAFAIGNGGSRDILDTPGIYAVLPGYGGPVPLSPLPELRDASLSIGDSIYLSGVPGLANGAYTLLPAHYALLPGAFAVRMRGGAYATADRPSFQQVDGSYLASGYRAVAGLPVWDQRVSSIEVLPQQVVRQYSQYVETSFNQYVTEQASRAGVLAARRPLDAGSLVLAVTASLALQGQGRFTAPAGGLLGNLDIMGNRIALVGEGRAAPDGFLALRVGELNRFGTGSLLVGGSRVSAAKGTRIDIAADSVVVDTGAGSVLAVPDLILAASGTVAVRVGSRVTATGVVANDAAPLLIGDAANGVPGDGALLRVTTGERVAVIRTGASGAGGRLEIGAEARLVTPGAILLDASNAMTVADSAVLDAPRIGLSSLKVSIGAAPLGTVGAVLSGTTLANFGRAQDLLIRSAGTIDFYGSAALGGRDGAGRRTLIALTLDAAGLTGINATASAVAETLVIRNSFGAAPGGTAGSGGTLALDAGTLMLGGGTSTLGGFAAVTARADRVVGTGQGLLSAAGALTIASDLVTVGKGADYTLSAGGALALTVGRGSAQAAEEFGGRLRLAGRTVSIDTTVGLPAGVLDAVASAGNVSLGDHARVLAGGLMVPFFDLATFAPGGTIRLTADAGSVMAAAGAVLDVSGAAGGGDAGRIVVSAVTGAADLAATLRGAAGAGFESGSFSLDAGSVRDFTSLNRSLNAGGLVDERSIRLRGQAITLAAGEALLAHDVLLKSDIGRIVIAGQILADGGAGHAHGGRVRLDGGAGVTLTGSGRITADADEARAGAYAAQSGRVEIVASGGSASLEAGSVISATGGARGGGTVIVAAGRNGQDILVDRLDARVTARAFILQGNRDYTQPTVGAGELTTALQDAAGWMNGAVPVIRQRLGSFAAIEPGIVFRTAGDLSLATDIDLHGVRFGGATGAIAFVAGGAITVNGSISDGFSDSSASGTLLADRSWSARLESGTDITVGAGRRIRTGTGDIALVAGRDLKFGDAASSVYTAGRKVADATGYRSTGRLGDHPVGGGDVVIQAGRDVGYVVPGTISNQFVTSWLFRYGRSDYGVDVPSARVAEQTGWSIYFPMFQGLGALGGGNVAIRAERDIRDIVAAVPTSGQQTTAVGQVVDARDLIVRGGGNLAVRAGGDIFGGIYLVGRGTAGVRAEGSLIADAQSLQRNDMPDRSLTRRDLHALFAISDAALTITARGDARISAVLDPMMVAQSDVNLGGRPQSYFFSYADRTSVAITSTGGQVVYQNNPWAAVDLTRGQGPGREIRMGYEWLNTPLPSITGDYLAYLPGTVRLLSQQGAITIDNRVTRSLVLAPSPSGTLDFLAGTAFGFGSTNSIDGQIRMLDIAPQYWRTALAPVNGLVTLPSRDIRAAILAPSSATNYDRGGIAPKAPGDVLVPGYNTSLHAFDRIPAHIYVRDGSAAVGLTLPKSAAVMASKDLGGNLTIQNNVDSDLSYVAAGRDLAVGIFVVGPGRLVAEAGRDVANSSIESSGNFPNRLYGNQSPAEQNFALRDVGADISILAGTAAAPQWEKFAASYLDPANARQVVRTYLPELRAYMRRFGVDGVGDEALVAAFQALPLAGRQPLLRSILFSELKETGIDATAPSGPRRNDYRRGYDAIALLFPPNAAQRGDIKTFGKIETLAGGRIEMLAPYGKITLGQEVTDENFDPNEVGVVTRKGGDIHIMARDNIFLGRSRVFTLQGGDIVMWTSDSDIAAGAGSKTTAVFPPLIYTISNDAFVSLNAYGLQTGAGIGALDATRTGTIRSRIDLIAPRGEINAGDAGIRVTGDINIAALRVVGIDNIQVGGNSTGIPKAQAPNISGLLTSNDTAGSAAKAAEPATRATTSEASPSIVIVEVIGYGGGDTPPAQPEDPRARTRRSDSSQSPDSPIQVIGSGRLDPDAMSYLTQDERKRLAR